MNMIADITSFNWESVLPVERTRLVRLSARLSGDYEAAEDLAQETLLEAWRVRHRLTDPRGYAPWLSAIARNVCLRWARRRGQQPAQLSLRDEADEIPALNAQMPPGAAYDVELELERDELATLLDRALALLPAETRTVLVERYVEETPLAEVAAWLRISEGTLAVRLNRGKL